MITECGIDIDAPAAVVWEVFSAAERWPERLAGRAVRSVDAHGKHLFVRFEGELTLHSHLRMTGTWGVHRAGERWRRAARRGREVRRALQFQPFLARFWPGRRL